MSDSCNPTDCSPPGSSVHRITQARILEWVAVSSSRDLPDSGIEPRSPVLQAGSLPLSHQGSSSVNLCMCVWLLQPCLTLSDTMDCSRPGSTVQGDSPDKKTRMGCYALLQRIFLTQGSNPGLLHCKQIFYRLESL